MPHTTIFTPLVEVKLMSTESLNDNDAKRQLAETVEQLRKSIRDPEAIRRTRERMDQMRAEVFEKFGTLNIAVDLIREARGECGEPCGHPAVSSTFVETLNRLRVTAEQMDRLICALNNLSANVLPTNPHLFAAMAEAPLEDLNCLRRDINRYAMELSFVR